MRKNLVFDMFQSVSRRFCSRSPMWHSEVQTKQCLIHCNLLSCQGFPQPASQQTSHAGHMMFDGRKHFSSWQTVTNLRTSCGKNAKVCTCIRTQWWHENITSPFNTGGLSKEPNGPNCWPWHPQSHCLLNHHLHPIWNTCAVHRD